MVHLGFLFDLKKIRQVRLFFLTNSTCALKTVTTYLKSTQSIVSILKEIQYIYNFSLTLEGAFE